MTTSSVSTTSRTTLLAGGRLPLIPAVRERTRTSRDDESSYEYDDPETGTPHGALTFFLTRGLSGLTPETSFFAAFERAAALVTANSSRHHPQIEGAADREILGAT